jgi:hypothetical protein
MDVAGGERQWRPTGASRAMVAALPLLTVCFGVSLID